MYYIGVMSGTSLDGVDLALMDFSCEQPQLIHADFYPMPPAIRQQISVLCNSGATTLQALGELDHQLGLLYTDCIQQFLQKHQLSPEQITAIGCHGQTVWHSPTSHYPFTMQIGDANLIAAKTGITTVADFRRKDMAFGGQGAPLVPAFHQALFRKPNQATVVLNVGGISNISRLLPNEEVIGYDTGPGNTLLDAWIEKHQGKAYDKDATWAKSGTVNHALLADLLDEAFFALPAPKSTGRELFNLAWLNKKLEKHTALSPQDVQATLVELTAQSIVDQLNQIETELDRYLLVCGGGVKNSLLMARLTTLLPQWQVQTTNDYGLDADYVEAAAFAWLAYQRLNDLPGNLPSVTGAKSAVSLGAIYPKEKDVAE
ncbi:TPA: anhydro-N-acetylmuramic acid kinase [Pasteurella multocida]|nr:anhydro-N-acetylmuramic acid kinase [Pasteurella multocida]MDY0577555.1 anhydro-N-acetylmuramic acid kinase [Pasteurella multocida]HDR1059751.1 anhydro-N-acetylmuramic acid kinase [Pasteurella multocida]HDR1105961.1 anhydro-N-acetylmuramic acid kinase [Pasteurella multocida]HDR1110400.1 anhydro-N-acetylmuramic acid kinase [Pasteurella multocida]HDR1128079.1 anhydro-N-acetylmuramic acid kinase [Pasteurella multocida]